MPKFEPYQWRAVGPDMPEFKARLDAAGIPWVLGLARNRIGGGFLYGVVIPYPAP